MNDYYQNHENNVQVQLTSVIKYIHEHKCWKEKSKISWKPTIDNYQISNTFAIGSLAAEYENELGIQFKYNDELYFTIIPTLRFAMMGTTLTNKMSYDLIMISKKDPLFIRHVGVKSFDMVYKHIIFRIEVYLKSF